MAGDLTDEFETKPYKIDAQNRVSLPDEIRSALGVRRGDVVAFRYRRGRVSLHRVSYRVED